MENIGRITLVSERGFDVFLRITSPSRVGLVYLKTHVNAFKFIILITPNATNILYRVVGGQLYNNGEFSTLLILSNMSKKDVCFRSNESKFKEGIIVRRLEKMNVVVENIFW